jgi:galactitol-specific phosphotransferase system IIC component
VVRTDKYYGLRLTSFICKSITVVSILLGIGIIGANIISLLNQESRPNNIDLFQIWASESIGILLVIGTLGFIFFIISQIIDVQMAINGKLHTSVDVVQSVDKIVDTLEKLGTPDTQKNIQHQEIMQALQHQNRMLSKMYKDIVDASEVSDDNSVPTKFS